MDIKFGEEASTFEIIQKVTNDKIGKLSLPVNLFKAKKSRHMHQVPSFLRTITIGEDMECIKLNDINN